LTTQEIAEKPEPLKVPILEARLSNYGVNLPLAMRIKFRLRLPQYAQLQK